eukprot:GHVS01080568.1.p2 GENE.GHVS01080568.1~~GHVS01080568.1.p2  ORF type:complete len:108 (+),score=61.32 GHVS01080568.1:513-836(+)
MSAVREGSGSGSNSSGTGSTSSSGSGSGSGSTSSSGSGSGAAGSFADIRKHLPKCKFPSPPNRYGILSGYRWDGVIRGTLFEEKIFQEKNKRAHQEASVYSQNWEDD